MGSGLLIKHEALLNHFDSTLNLMFVFIFPKTIFNTYRNKSCESRTIQVDLKNQKLWKL